MNPAIGIAGLVIAHAGGVDGGLQCPLPGVRPAAAGAGGRGDGQGAVNGRVEAVTAEDVGMAAQGGDPLASEVITQAATYLGAGMANLVNIFNPEMIIVGGGVAKMGELLLGTARQIVKERAFSLPAQAVRIVTARLGDDAGVVGAAVFARERKSG